MTEVLDVLVAVGARITSLGNAAAAGNITGWPLARFTPPAKIGALISTADHQRLEVIEQLVAAGTRSTSRMPGGGRCRCTSPRKTDGQPASGG